MARYRRDRGFCTQHINNFSVDFIIIIIFLDANPNTHKMLSNSLLLLLLLSVVQRNVWWGEKTYEHDVDVT